MLNSRDESSHPISQIQKRACPNPWTARLLYAAALGSSGCVSGFGMSTPWHRLKDPKQASRWALAGFIQVCFLLTFARFRRICIARPCLEQPVQAVSGFQHILTGFSNPKCSTQGGNILQTSILERGLRGTSHDHRAKFYKLSWGCVGSSLAFLQVMCHF